MKLQKATQFGLYAVLELAREPDRQLSALDIAETYGISSHHLAKVLRDLVRAGLAESVRGAGGGYKFCGNTRRTTLMDIIHIFEEIGSDTIFSEREIEGTDIGSALQVVLGEIDDIARATFRSITIQTLLKTITWQRERALRAGNH